jgi:hypothetical protein
VDRVFAAQFSQENLGLFGRGFESSTDDSHDAPDTPVVICFQIGEVRAYHGLSPAMFDGTVALADLFFRQSNSAPVLACSLGNIG